MSGLDKSKGGGYNLKQEQYNSERNRRFTVALGMLEIETRRGFTGKMTFNLLEGTINTMHKEEVVRL